MRSTGGSGTGRLGSIISLAGLLAMIALGAVMLLTTADVVTRYVLVKPITGAVDVSTFLLVFLATMSLAYAQRQGRHVGVQLVTQRLSDSRRRRLQFFSLIFALSLFALMSWAAGRSAFASWQQHEFWFSAIRFPAWPIKLSLFAGFALLWIQLLGELRAVLVSRK